MIEIPTASDVDIDPVESALIDWIASADLYRDGVLTRSEINLVGANNPHIARHYARAITEHLAAHGPDLEALETELLNIEGAGRHVRAHAFAREIAEGILAMLDRHGLLP